MTRTDRHAEPRLVTWGGVTRVKRNSLKSSVTVSVTATSGSARVGCHRTWVVYRDGIPEFDAFVEAFSAALHGPTLDTPNHPR